METMAGKKPRRRRSFSPEFKSEVVALVGQPGKTVGGVARDMDLTETAVREWVRQAERDEGKRADGLSTAERAEMAQLRKELRETREERDILKRAVAFFAREIRRAGCGSSRRRRRSITTSPRRVSCSRSPGPPSMTSPSTAPRPASSPMRPWPSASRRSSTPATVRAG